MRTRTSKYLTRTGVAAGMSLVFLMFYCLSANAQSLLDALSSQLISPHSCVATNIKNDSLIRRIKSGLRNNSPRRTIAVTCSVSENLSEIGRGLAANGQGCTELSYTTAAVVDVNSADSPAPAMRLIKQAPVNVAGGAPQLFTTDKVTGVASQASPTTYDIEIGILCSQPLADGGTQDLLLYQPVVYLFLPPKSTLRLLAYIATTQS